MSKIEKRLQDESDRLSKLEAELCSLLKMLQPENELAVWQRYDVKKDIDIFWVKLKKWEVVEIIDINLWEKWCTTTVLCCLKDWQEIQFSSWIFIMYFCDELIIKYNKLRNREKDLRSAIEKEKRRLKDLKWNWKVDNQVENVRWRFAVILDTFLKMREIRKWYKNAKDKIPTD